ncbi:MAG: galactose ABC transporter substrate-binding protein [Herbinix sp.]|nr:galactose ABC transporter substrate-binding protein [Herbinix sp.]
MKSNLKLFILVLLLFSCFTTGCSNAMESASKTNDKISVGVLVGTYDDTWRTLVRNQLYQMAEEENIEMSIWNSDSSEDTQSQNVDLLIQKKVDVLVVNPVNSSSSENVINKAKKADIPVIFFNIEPSSEVIQSWDKAYYVGAIAEKSGTMQGQILADYFKENLPVDNTIRYVMLKGPEEYQDAVLRSKYSIQALEKAGFQVSEVATEIADWDRENAKEKMTTILQDYDSEFNCVLANNDDMALGAIDALKSAGYFSGGKYIPVVGVDATSSAQSAVKNGTLLGTVLNDAANQSTAIFELATLLAENNTPNENNITYPITDKQYIWIDYKKVTKEDITSSAE